MLGKVAGIFFAGVLVTATPAFVAAAEMPVVEGEIRDIDLEQDKLTIRHGPLPHLGMDMDMTMVFTVDDPAMLEGLEEGDAVWFQADRIDGTITVVRISEEPFEDDGGHEHGEGHDDDGEHGHGEQMEEHSEAHGEHAHEDNHGGHDMTGGMPATHYDYDRTIVVDAADIEFDQTSIDVKDGETIRFLIANSGDIEHEFNIGTAEMHVAHQEEMIEMMDALMNGEGMHHAHGNSVFLLPGETRVLVWTFEHAHDLEFACNVPGHYEAGMRGSINFVH